MKKIFYTILIFLISLNQNITVQVLAETLDSSNYQIIDSQVGGFDLNSSANYSLIDSLSSISDSRLDSTNYRIQSGTPSTFIANVPKIRCFETTTNSGSTTCTELPNNNGMIGVCGFGGCYNKAKLEIDNQSNPQDTLYLVQVIDVTNSITYFLQSDHTLSTNFDINDFMDLCDISGRDNNNDNCNDSGDIRWNASLQKYNVLGLKPNTQYSVSVSAMHGNFTGSDFSTSAAASTVYPNLAFDIDITDDGNPNADTNLLPVKLGILLPGQIITADNGIWFDVNTNIYEGITLRVKDQYSGLYNTAATSTIPSISEDLGIDVDGNGGFGLKFNTFDNSTVILGPIQKSSTYDTLNSTSVGGLSTTDSIILTTNNSGLNSGPIINGRAGLYVKSKAVSSTKAGDYTDTLTFTLAPN